MKHPEDELYSQLEPAFAARGVRGFEGGLKRLAAVVEKGAPVAEVETAYQALQREIDQAEGTARKAKLGDRLLVVAQLVREAAEEYEEAVENGEIHEAHEYQDALGFIRVARQTVNDICPTDRARAANAVETIEAQLKAIEPAWPNAMPPKRALADPSLIYGAAARMEIAAPSVK